MRAGKNGGKKSGTGRQNQATSFGFWSDVRRVVAVEDETQMGESPPLSERGKTRRRYFLDAKKNSFASLLFGFATEVLGPKSDAASSI